MGRIVWLFAVLAFAAPDTFRVGSYGGIVPGKSTRAEVLRKWGTPAVTGGTEDGSDFVLFRDPERRGWDIEVWFVGRTVRVESILVKFKERKARAEVERLFGLRLSWKSYKIDHCSASGGFSAVYEVPERGDLEVYEDRAHGVVSRPIGIEVVGLEFSASPVARPRSRCAGKK